MVAVLGYSKDQILDAVKDMYAAVATAPDGPFHFPVGSEAARLVGYPDDVLADLPEAALESFAGVGYPFRADCIEPGDEVLDLGSGAGTDVLVASRIVGGDGRVRALDMTPSMTAKLRRLVTAHAIGNVEVLDGTAEAIPLADASVDVITSNGVLNLVPDKRKAVAEMFRVLRPGGRVQLADIVIGRPVTPDCRDDPRMWAECVVGATIYDDYLRLFADAGFTEIEVLREFDYFAHSPSLETRRIAAGFDARAVELRMRRGDRAPHKVRQLARRLDPRRLLVAVERRGAAGMLALGLAVLACYGTLAVTSILSLVGITLAVNEGAWAGAIVLFTLLTALTLAASARKHRAAGPAVVAAVGAAVMIYTLFASYSPVVELAAFALLAAAALWDYRLRGGMRVRASHTQP